MPVAAPRRRAVRPRDAASLILVDRSGAQPRFLMGRRHSRHVFMPDAFVFPGGRLERSDSQATPSGLLAPRAEQALIAASHRASAAKARGLALCALRETFEETGLLVGLNAEGVPTQGPEAWQGFVRQAAFDQARPLHFVARAITPPRYPRRFDTRFFLADSRAIAGRIDGVVGPDSEFTELRWLSLDDTASFALPDITRTILDEAMARLAGDLAPELPVPFFRTRHRRWGREEI